MLVSLAHCDLRICIFHLKICEQVCISEPWVFAAYQSLKFTNLSYCFEETFFSVYSS